MKRTLLSSSKILLVIIYIELILVAGCRKKTMPEVGTLEVHEITTNTAISGGNIVDDGGATVAIAGVCWNTDPGPSISDKTTIDKPVSGLYTSNLSGLEAGKSYFVRAYATNAIGTSYGNEVSFLTVPDRVNDIDGNVYSAITVGTQVWLAENLKTTKYADGSSIPSSFGFENGLLVWYNNDSATYKKKCGGLYNWYAVTSSKHLCPIGWHVPSKQEWNILINNVGGASTAGNMLRGTQYGFNAPLAGGWVMGSFSGIGQAGYYWTTTINDAHPGLRDYGPFYLEMSLSPYVSFGSQLGIAACPSCPLSVRCIKDEIVPTLSTSKVTEITCSDAKCGGMVTNAGVVTARGVCWSEGDNPSLSDYKTIDGTGGGSFTSYISDLKSSTTYFVRSYATNSAGTGYGPVMSFTTLKGTIPSLSTTPATTTTGGASFATGGYIDSDGGSAIIERGVCWGTSKSPSINNFKTIDGSGKGSFLSLVTELKGYTSYYLRAYATNSIGTGYGDQIQFSTPAIFTGQTGIVKDFEGNSYKTIGIGNQIWMAENLKSTKYNDGSIIPNVQDNVEWRLLSSDAFCDYENNQLNSAIYGRLYNWFILGHKDVVCPTGWHLPSSSEWTVLTDLLGGKEVAGGKLKESGTTHWSSPNTGATNETGFSALPGGNRYYDGRFFSLGQGCQWWTSDGDWSSLAGKNAFSIGYNSSGCAFDHSNYIYGLSVRCIKNK
jgi:uncharacterized protein (TIGR02145 family)